MRLTKTHVRVKSILSASMYCSPSFFQLIFCKVIDGLPMTQPDDDGDSVYLRAAKCL
jgi:hypothetical protein